MGKCKMDQTQPIFLFLIFLGFFTALLVILTEQSLNIFDSVRFLWTPISRTRNEIRMPANAKSAQVWFSPLRYYKLSCYLSAMTYFSLQVFCLSSRQRIQPEADNHHLSDSGMQEEAVNSDSVAVLSACSNKLVTGTTLGQISEVISLLITRTNWRA